MADSAWHLQQSLVPWDEDAHSQTTTCGQPRGRGRNHMPTSNIPRMTFGPCLSFSSPRNPALPSLRVCLPGRRQAPAPFRVGSSLANADITTPYCLPFLQPGAQTSLVYLVPCKLTEHVVGRWTQQHDTAGLF